MTRFIARITALLAATALLGCSHDETVIEGPGETPRLPTLSETPGGEPGTAPIVGCEDAERPARRLDSATESCDAQGGGRCWYIDPDGDDEAEGSFAAPYATPQKAIRQASPGDIIYLRGGVYDDSNAHVSRALVWGDPTAGVARRFMSIGRISLPSWVEGDGNYEVATGTQEAPIVVRSFPGERACADGAGGIGVGALSHEIAYWRIEDITVKGAAVGVGGGSQEDGELSAQTNHITIARLEIYEYAADGGSNVGLVKINRGDWGGPSEIFVLSNILHDLYDLEDATRLAWNETSDAQHFGSVCTLSCETYIDAECMGSGRVVIQNNHIYRVPAAFFFKNPSLGPFQVQDNVLHDFQYLGQWAPSNITFVNNLLYGQGGGARVGGFGGSIMEAIYERAGHHLIMENNTFIGYNTAVEFRIYAAGHRFRGNVVQGLTNSMSDTSWNNMGLIFQASSWVYPDTATEVIQSQLAQANDFDDNCYVTPVTDFIAYGRRYKVGDDFVLTHLSLEEARTTLGFDEQSTVTPDPTAVFEDFPGGSYRITPGGPCAGRGATPPAWQP